MSWKRLASFSIAYGAGFAFLLFALINTVSPGKAAYFLLADGAIALPLLLLVCRQELPRLRDRFLMAGSSWFMANFFLYCWLLYSRQVITKMPMIGYARSLFFIAVISALVGLTIAAMSQPRPSALRA
jgi:hypothetical protein